MDGLFELKDGHDKEKGIWKDIWMIDGKKG